MAPSATMGRASVVTRSSPGMAEPQVPSRHAAQPAAPAAGGRPSGQMTPVSRLMSGTPEAVPFETRNWAPVRSTLRNEAPRRDACRKSAPRRSPATFSPTNDTPTSDARPKSWSARLTVVPAGKMKLAPSNRAPSVLARNRLASTLARSRRAPETTAPRRSPWMMAPRASALDRFVPASGTPASNRARSAVNPTEQFPSSRAARSAIHRRDGSWRKARVKGPVLSPAAATPGGPASPSMRPVGAMPELPPPTTGGDDRRGRRERGRSGRSAQPCTRRVHAQVCRGAGAPVPAPWVLAQPEARTAVRQSPGGYSTRSGLAAAVFAVTRRVVGPVGAGRGHGRTRAPRRHAPAPG